MHTEHGGRPLDTATASPAQEPRDSLAPVIPLFPPGGRAGREANPPGGRAGREAAVSRPPTITKASNLIGHATWAGDPDHEDDASYDEGDVDDCASIEREIAEKNLLKKLRTRSLSIREARAVVAERDLDTESVDAVIDAFVRLGYLDDAALADQLVHAAVDRKGQGRQLIAQTLARRGVPRDVADAAIGDLPDDDADRALEFARSTARSMTSLDHDTALRRLSGQLARRGYRGSVALNAAKQALSESGSTSVGVRFR